MTKYYPDSEVELTPKIAKYYDQIMNIGSLGIYNRFIEQAIAGMDIESDDKILDFGAGTGRNALIMHKYLAEQGEVTGLEISEQMLSQFRNKTKNVANISVKNQRIDQPFSLDQKYDIVFIAFVLHGFPHKIRKVIIENAYRNLKEKGRFIILDFNEFHLQQEPFYFRIAFKTIECKYAFDFVERDWQKILNKFGFGYLREQKFFRDYVRLLISQKNEANRYN